MNNLSYLFQQLRSYAPRSCVEDGDKSHTYAQLIEELERWQLRLDQLNIEPGMVVGLRADYSVAAIAVLLALCARHAIAALIPWHGDVNAYLSDACAAGFIELSVSGDCKWRSITTTASHPLIAQLRAAGHGGLIIFTSGSTGRPKAALHSIERFLTKFRRPCRQFRTLAFLVLDHVAGVDTLLYTLAGGGTLILTRQRTPRAILQLIASHRVDVLPASPSILRMLCAIKDGDGFDLSSLKIVTYGSEPMDSSTLTRLNRRFPNVEIGQKYGTTEAGSPRSVSRGNDSLWVKIKTGGGVETRIIDCMLWIRSEGATLGYLNSPSPFDEEGWYCTGDVVEVDGDWIRFCGRASDIINVGGEKVSPAEVEQTILELDFVQEVAVWGEPHALLGHIIAARGTLSDPAMNQKESARLIQRHCRLRLAPHKVPMKIDLTIEPSVSCRQKLPRRRLSD